MGKKKSKNSKRAAVHKGYGKPCTTMSVVEKETAGSDGDKSPISGRPYFEVANAVCGGSPERVLVLNARQKKLLDVQGVAINLLLKAYNSMIELAAVRLECKLSNTRVTGVARELKELIKVMSVYDC